MKHVDLDEFIKQYVVREMVTLDGVKLRLPIPHAIEGGIIKVPKVTPEESLLLSRLDGYTIQEMDGWSTIIPLERL